MKNLPSNSNSTKPNTPPHRFLESQPQQNQTREEQEEEEEEEEEERARCEWDITLSAVITSRISNNSTTSSTSVLSDALGVVEFDPTGCFLATGGIARKIRLYNLDSLLPFSSTVSCNSNTTTSVVYIDHASVEANYCICTPAKLSSLKWKPGSGGRVIGFGDYDGVVMEYDLETKVPVFERDEHGGRRVWSVDYSRCGDPLLGASGSDDGSMQLWDPRCEGGERVGAVWPSKTASSLATSSVCCVEFNPLGGWMVAVGCADKRAYVYDTRMLDNPVNVLEGHNKTVTYVKFLDNMTLVSSSIDGCLRLWDLGEGTARVVRTYKGHVNARNFVGLSVWRDGGLFGCGSENNQVYVYDKRWGEPIWVHGFELVGGSGGGGGHVFVSSVCWRQAVGEEEDHCMLVAGGSDGALQVFQGRRKSGLVISC